MRLRDVLDEYGCESWIGEEPTDTIRYKTVKKSTLFYDTPAWKKLRLEVLAYYGKVCMKCKRKKVILQVDHIKPRCFYPRLELDFNNLQVLCVRCNKEKGVVTEDYREVIRKP